MIETAREYHRGESPRFRSRTSFLICFFFLGLSALAAPMTEAAPIDKREVEARKDFASGHYQEALDTFSDLFAQTGDLVYLRNIARCYQRMKRPDEAIANFQDYLSKDRSLSAAERQQIDGYIKEMESLRAERERARPAANPLVSPVTPPLPQAEHPPSSTPPPTAPVPSVVPAPSPVEESAGSDLKTDIGADNANHAGAVHPWRTAGIVTAAGGAVLVGAGLLFGLAARSASDDVSRQYDAGRESAGQRDAVLQWVGYGIGAAAIAVGALLFAHEGDAPSAGDGGALHASVTPGGLAVGGRF